MQELIQYLLVVIRLVRECFIKVMFGILYVWFGFWRRPQHFIDWYIKNKTKRQSESAFLVHLLSAVEAVLLLSKLLLSGEAIFNSMAKKKKKELSELDGACNEKGGVKGAAFLQNLI